MARTTTFINADQGDSSAHQALKADDLSFRYGDTVVFDGFSFTAAPGQRVGLVGENGAGKSTLLELFAGAKQPQSGTIQHGGDIGYLLQEPPFSAQATFSEALDEALREIRSAAVRLDGLTCKLADFPDDTEVLKEYGKVLEWAQIHDLWDADRRARLVCEGLGLGEIAETRKVGTLSGGQRARLGLAALLIRQPGTLLLDEPTNHLDDDAMEFLEKHLAALSGVVVLSSHDRVFLDAVCTDIVDLDPAMNGPTRYGGNYSEYRNHKRAERARWEQRFVQEQEELKELRHAVSVTAPSVAHNRAARDKDKMLYSFKTGRVQKQISRRVRNAQLRLTELERDQVRKPPKPLTFASTALSTSAPSGPAPSTSAGGEEVGGGKILVSARDIAVAGRLHIGHLDITETTRLLVTGGNGSGKSTLLDVLSSEVTPETGSVMRARGTRVGLLPQEVSFTDPTATAREIYRKTLGDQASPLVHLGLIAPRDLDRPVGVLSVGQRRRLALALLIARPPEVLLLDEPTNHISLALTEELFAALENTPRALVIASHDRWLRRDWTHERLDLQRLQGADR
jgi:macrolide transport system ATP-binding/permease protein